MKVMEVHRIHFTEIDSTNAWAKEHGAEFDPKKLTCITADVQTAGRGLYANRRWVSKKGNLHMSLFLAIPPDPNLSQILPFAAVQVIQKENLFVQIKWPNDVLVEGKKICGVLVENTPQGVVLGLGMNVNTKIETDQPTTSLKELTKKEWDLENLALAISEKFLENWQKGFLALKEEFEKLLAYKGESITCKIGEKILEGILLGITDEGHLQIEREDGTIHQIFSGEIHQLRSN
ncbi:MAG: Bifunctional ligase/repressor BirA [Chlamydiae bacterium]|nr:Bifunctional ligase/repressor BirA [Chlamydiota bacterium]